jgi:hypothetical protein
MIHHKNSFIFFFILFLSCYSLLRHQNVGFKIRPHFGSECLVLSFDLLADHTNVFFILQLIQISDIVRI